MEPDAPAARDDDPGAGDSSAAPLASRLRFPRLSHAQWEATITDLFHLDAPTGLSASFTPDPLAGKVFDNNEAALRVTPGLWADYQRAAEEVALFVTGNPARFFAILPPDLPADPALRREAFITSFGRRAFRRPLTAGEIARHVELFEQALALDDEHDPFVAGARLSIEAFLQSPHFLYRPELSGSPRPDGSVALSDHEIAARLSYALWGTTPDDRLLDAADAGALSSQAGVEAEARRLLGDERARRILVEFHDQLLDADQYLAIHKSPYAYPGFDPAIGADMRRELALFVAHVLFAERGGFAELLMSRTSFVNARLAAVYGLDAEGFDADTFVGVELPESERVGLLTRAGFLAWKGTETDPDTILRGVFVNRRILCQDLGDPPPEAMGKELGDEETNRERVTALTGKGTCGETCHGTFINPVGFAFEHYGAMGEHRELDAGHPIDATGVFPFREGERSYDGALELSAIVAGSDQAHRCYVKHWLQYLHGRDDRAQDRALVREVAALSRSGAGVEDIVTALVTSDAFRTRNAGEVSP